MSEITENNTIRQLLISIPESEYGEKYQEHVLRMYQDWVASAEKVTDRRNTANAWFLPICTGFLGVYSTLLVEGVLLAESTSEVTDHAYFLVALSALGGIAFSLIWLGVISSYKAWNSAKFAVIHQIEKLLPLAPYKAEYWAYKNRPGKTMVAFSSYESYMPWVFISMYCVVFLALSLNMDAGWADTLTQWSVKAPWFVAVIGLGALLVSLKFGSVAWHRLNKNPRFQKAFQLFHKPR